MRFLELYLKAFGPFTERDPIELPDLDGPGLCVIHGSNEAGKTTALRAIHALLYGIPPRSPDDFVHRYPELRVGARLRFDDGEELALMRRKKAKDSVYSYDDGEVIEAKRLDQLVEAVPEALFERFYGIDHRGLTEGSAALLQDDGEVGKALFGAGLGVSNLRAVLAGLESEAAELFAPRASKPRINAALADWKEAQKEVGAVSLDPREWAAQESVVQEGQARRDALELEIEAARRDLSRLERLKRSMPAVARRRAARERLEAQVSVARLPEDFAERLTTARADRRAAEEGKRRADAKIERETAAREGLSLAPELIVERERIESLHQRVGGYQEALDQLPRRDGKLARLDEEIDSLVGSGAPLSAERVASLREVVAQAGSIRALANEGLKLSERLSKSREEVAEARSDLERMRVDRGEEAGREHDPAPLRRALARAAKLGPIDERLVRDRAERDAIDLEIGRGARQLGLDPQRVEAIDGLPIPADEAIDAMRERFAEWTRESARQREEFRTLRGEGRRIDEALSRIRNQGAVPQASDLDAQRAERDGLWREVRRTAIDAETPPDQGIRSDLADRFERASAEADSVGDRLRLDAERVAERASLEAQAARVDHDLAELREWGEQLARAGESLEAEWTESWAQARSELDIEAGTPDEMRGWRRGLDALIGQLARRRELSLGVDRDASGRRDAIEELHRALSEAEWPGERDPSDAADPTHLTDLADLADWIEEAEAWRGRLEESESARRRRVELARQIEERVDRSTLRAERDSALLEEWRASWRDAVASLDLADLTRPELALERLDTMAELLERLREREELAERVEKMRLDVAAFEQGVRDLVEQCAPELADRSPDAATMGLQRMLGDALNEQTLLGKCEDALAEAVEEREEAIAQERSSGQVMAELVALARVDEESELDEALRRWREVEEEERALRQAEAELTNLAEGRSLEELERETADADSDVLTADIARLQERLDRLADDQKHAIEELRSQRDRLEQMSGSARVAELAERAESTLAKIRRDVDRYVQVRLAKQILENEIERYRSENQAPILKRSSEIFSALTRGAYPRIASEVDEGGAGLRMVAVRSGGAEVPVARLSSGTRDQLFMAMRLASLEDSLGRGETMPLVADDILIEFDDERSRATLEVLADVAGKTQILLFSHHLHIAEIARDLGGRAFVVEL